MTKTQLIELLKLLSTIESWSFSEKSGMPDYLLERLDSTIELVTNEVLK